ncbi:MAG: hypothetical protein DRP13_04460 [Candidatus Aenigmatarchaeota archaeon]|nr:MAG: hypothetical protein DRP13_04460 [Candidatus Aenigmarchaeota archaeon]
MVVFSLDKTIKVLIALARERLTKKQKLILRYLRDNHENITVTSLVPVLSEKLNCSESAVWNNLRSLRKASLVSYGCLDSKGIPAKLTDFGEIVSRELEVRV